MIDVESPYTVADLSRNPSGVSGDEFAGLGFSNSITNRKCLDHSESLSWRNLVFFFFFLRKFVLREISALSLLLKIIHIGMNMDMHQNMK